MRVLVFTGSRADRNGLEAVYDALIAAGHSAHIGQDDRAWNEPPDVVVVAGDRFEVLEKCFETVLSQIPICHIAGGDVTEGSMDDRFRDAITALASIHCTTNIRSYRRVSYMARKGDLVVCTGSPAIDKIRQTPVLPRNQLFSFFGLSTEFKTVLVTVHPNTAVGDDPFADFNTVLSVLNELDGMVQVLWLGANADRGGERINEIATCWCADRPDLTRFRRNILPVHYYSAMAHFDVMLGNSSAGVYEAPSFGLPVVNVGNRQHGRIIPPNVRTAYAADKPNVARALLCGWLGIGRCECNNPYGDGKSAPRIVQAIERFMSKS